jgi:subtilase family serine protease
VVNIDCYDLSFRPMPEILSARSTLMHNKVITAMSTLRRKSLRFEATSLEAFEERLLLSNLPVTHVHALRVQAHPLSRPIPATIQLHPAALHARAHPLLQRVAASNAPHPLAGTGSPPTSALTPAQTRHIYGIDAISNLGSGQTIAIVDAYDDPNIASDADVFDQTFRTTLVGTPTPPTYYDAYGPSSSWLTKAYASGTKPRGDTGWGQEISLDVEWAHAIAPQAHILLVEAKSSSFSDLLAANQYAVNHGASVISNSWGGGEFSGETSYDSNFTAHGVTFVFSAGDSGNQSYPATSPDVLSVGGTTLSHDSGYKWTAESGWSSGGGGVSGYETKPGYQSGLSYSNRANPDIAYDADPSSGFAVYDSYGRYYWKYTFGGTSAGAPQWSAILALANQGRAALSKSSLDGLSQTLPTIYKMTTGTDGTQPLDDVTTGSNSVGSAGPGYDLVTGRGTPRRADLVYQALLNA